MDLHQHMTHKLLHSFWKKLKGWNHAILEAIETSESHEEKRKGHAQVEVEEKSETELHFKEKGTWDKTQISFTNIWRWTLLIDKERIKLEHLRLGENHPVSLIELKILEKDHLTCEKPHLCGQDQYQATCFFKGKKLYLEWQVVGPQKNQTLRFIYSKSS